MHCTRSPQERQATKLEKPRRLSRTMVCSPFSRRCADGFQQLAREGRLLARFQKLLAHVDQFHRRHGPRFDAPGQFEQRVLAALGVVAALQAGRGRAQHHARARPPARARWPRRGRCSAEFLPACSCRRALRPPRSGPDCAPARRRRSACPPPPTAAPERMRRHCSERSTSVKALCRMATRSPKREKNWPAIGRRERDFRHQQQRAAAFGQRGLDGVQIDLGLARPGDAVEQKRAGSVSPGWPRESARTRPAARGSGRAARGSGRRSWPRFPA